MDEDVDLPLSPGSLKTPIPSMVSSPPPLPSDDSPHLLSLNAMSGMPAPKTFHAYGTIHHHKITILVDGGSTHNFVKLRVPKFLDLSSTPIDPLLVMVGHGGVMQCWLRYPQVSIAIQGHQFTTYLFGLPLSGADIVLGVQWLKDLGPVTTDYTFLSMFFTHLGRPIHLVANIPLRPPTTSAHQLKRMMHSQAVSALFHIAPPTSPSQTTSPSLVPNNHPPPSELTTLLAKFHKLFNESSQLPPVRPISNHIHLSPTPNPSQLNHIGIPIAKR